MSNSNGAFRSLAAQVSASLGPFGASKITKNCKTQQTVQVHPLLGELVFVVLFRALWNGLCRVSRVTFGTQIVCNERFVDRL